MVYNVPKIPVCVAIGCCGLALVFQLVAIAGTGWIVNKATGVEASLGLFRICSLGECIHYKRSEISGWLKVSQAFSILGFFAIAGSLAVGILHAVLKNTRALSLLAIVLCAASVVALIIELSVFGGKTGDSVRGSDSFSFGYGFIFSIIACFLSWGAALCFVLGLRK